MTVQTTPALPHDKIVKDALLSGGINAVINGIIQYFLLRGSDTIPLTLDSISGGSHAVLGSAVLLSVSLAMILTVVTHATLKVPKKPFYPDILKLVFRHGLMAFGSIVAIAVLWQWMFGTIEVGLMAAIILLGLIAGIVSAIVNYFTISESIL